MRESVLKEKRCLDILLCYACRAIYEYCARKIVTSSYLYYVELSCHHFRMLYWVDPKCDCRYNYCHFVALLDFGTFS